MGQTNRSNTYTLKVEMSPADYPDAGNAGSFSVVLGGDHLVADLCDVIERRTGTDYCDSHHRFRPDYLDFGGDDSFESLGLGQGDMTLFSGYVAFYVTVVSITSSTRPPSCPYVTGDDFDTDWMAELVVRAEREHEEELGHWKAEVTGTEPPAAGEEDHADATTDYRVEWAGEIVEQATGRAFRIGHKGREDETPALDMLQGIIAAGGTDGRMPFDVGLLHLLGPGGEVVRTLDCRERKTWGSETFVSLGVPAVPVDDGAGDPFDAHLARFEARGRRDAGFSGDVLIRVYSNAEFWKRKLRGRRV